MTFSVHVATLADVPALATVSRAAFKDHPIVGYLGRDVPPEIFYTFLCQQYQQRFHTSPLTGVRTFKAIDDETGWVVFTLPIGIRDTQETQYQLEELRGFKVPMHRFTDTDKQQRYSRSREMAISLQLECRAKGREGEAGESSTCETRGIQQGA